MCVSSLHVGLAWGVLCGVLGEYAVVLFSKLMHLQCTMSYIFVWEVRRLCITVSGFAYFHKNCRFLWKKNVSKTNLEVQYTISIRHITNISDFYGFRGVAAQ